MPARTQVLLHLAPLAHSTRFYSHVTSRIGWETHNPQWAPGKAAWTANLLRSISRLLHPDRRTNHIHAWGRLLLDPHHPIHGNLGRRVLVNLSSPGPAVTGRA
jgi:hypothetical protein